MTVYD